MNLREPYRICTSLGFLHARVGMCGGYRLTLREFVNPVASKTGALDIGYGLMIALGITVMGLQDFGMTSSVIQISFLDTLAISTTSIWETPL